MPANSKHRARKNSAGNTGNATVQQQFLSTLKWLILVILVVTGSITWKLVANDATRMNGASALLDLPRELCGTVVGSGGPAEITKEPSTHEAEASIRPPTASPQTNTLGSTLSQTSACEQEYQRVTATRTQGITKIDLENSRALMGNRHRLAVLAKKLQSKEKPINAIFCGGSITIGHGVQR